MPNFVLFLISFLAFLRNVNIFSHFWSADSTTAAVGATHRMTVDERGLHTVRRRPTTTITTAKTPERKSTLKQKRAEKEQTQDDVSGAVRRSSRLRKRAAATTSSGANSISLTE